VLTRPSLLLEGATLTPLNRFESNSVGPALNRRRRDAPDAAFVVELVYSLGEEGVSSRYLLGGLAHGVRYS
jgi:hypothetical protein